MIRFQRIKQDIDFRLLPALVVCGLCFYFSYHLLQGERSVWSYVSNKTAIEEKQAELAKLQKESSDLEEKVVKLRVATLDADYLEERARYLLGYIGDDEIVLMPKK